MVRLQRLSPGVLIGGAGAWLQSHITLSDRTLGANPQLRCPTTSTCSQLDIRHQQTPPQTLTRTNPTLATRSQWSDGTVFVSCHASTIEPMFSVNKNQYTLSFSENYNAAIPLDFLFQKQVAVYISWDIAIRPCVGSYKHKTSLYYTNDTLLNKSSPCILDRYKNLYPR